jgi:hypothetical protein
LRGEKQNLKEDVTGWADNTKGIQAMNDNEKNSDINLLK